MNKYVAVTTWKNALIMISLPGFSPRGIMKHYNEEINLISSVGSDKNINFSIEKRWFTGFWTLKPVLFDGFSLSSSQTGHSLST